MAEPLPPLVDQPNPAPTRKLTGATIGAAIGGGAITAPVILAIWNFAFPLYPMTIEVALAIVAVATVVPSLVGFIVGYFRKDRDNTPATPPAARGIGACPARPPMVRPKRYQIAPFVLILVLLTGCEQFRPPAPETAREVVVTAEAAFTQAVRLATAHKSDLSPDQVEIVDRAITAGDVALDTAEQAILAGNDASAWIAAALGHATDIMEVLQ